MEKKLHSGANTAINTCLEVSPKDSVVIITDNETKEVGTALFEESNKAGARTQIFIIEEFTQRPANELPETLKNKIMNQNPTVSIYAAQGQQGELPVFRAPLINFLTNELNCRHAHMISITKELMEDGMNKDYAKVYEVTNKVLAKVKKAVKIRVKDEYGTSINADFDSHIKWIPDHGKIEQGEFANLPAGEIYTSPKSVDGRFVGWVIGDYLGKKYGVMENPLTVEIKNGVVTNAYSKNDALANDFINYINEHENGNRVGEFGIGTLIGLTKFTGNLLQDEKFPGIHMAFGSPYPEKTGRDWDCPSHIDLIAKDTTVTLHYSDNSEEILMKDGKYVF